MLLIGKVVYRGAAGSHISNLVIVCEFFGGSGVQMLVRLLAMGDGIASEVLLNDFVGLLGSAALGLT